MALTRIINKNRKKSGFFSQSGKLAALMSAAMAIPGITVAQVPAEGSEWHVSWTHYQEYQKGGDDRMKVMTPQVWMRAPAGTQGEIEGSFVLDTMSGASPYYLSTLTGASGTGIEDFRKAADLKYTHYFENFSLGFGGSFSDENDYTSRGLSLDSRLWSDDKNTTLAFGIAGNHDSISSSLNSDINENRDTYNFLVGITQVIDENSIVQSNLTYGTGDGYFSDPYKLFDKRPHSREQWAWLTRYNRYFADLDGSLHTDYRLYRDTWGVTGHTFDVAWYQPFGEGWMIRPRVRYYSQDRATFFSDRVPPDDFETLFSADQRLGDFGEIGLGLKLSKEFESGLTLEAGFDYFQQRTNWQLGGGGSSDILPMDARIVSLGISKKFK